MSELDRSEDARNAFAKSVESDANFAEAHYNLSFVLSTLGDYDGALRSVTRAQTLDPYYVPQKFRLAIDLQLADPMITVVPEISADLDTDATAASFALSTQVLDEIFAELAPPAPPSELSDAEDPFSPARGHLERGAPELATAEVKRAMADGADPIEGNQLLGTLFARQGLHGEGLERFREVRAMNPDRVDARTGELRALLAMGRGQEGAADAEALILEHPQVVEVLSVVAEVRLANGEFPEAMAALGEARVHAPQRADLLRLEGNIHLQLGDPPAAIRAYQFALDLDPKLADLQFRLAQIHEEGEDWEAAERAYRAALEVLPTYSQAAVALANLSIRHGNAGTAVDLLVEILSMYPSDVDALFALARALLDDGRGDQALQALNRLVAFDDDHLEAFFFMGVVLGRQGQYRPAITAFERVVALDPTSAAALRAREHMRSAGDLQKIFDHEAA